MKIKARKLKNIIKEMVLDEQIRLAQDSLDDQIDSIILGLESDALLDNQPEDTIIGGEEEHEQEFEVLMNLDKLLEAPEDEEEEDPADDEEGDEEEPLDDPAKEEPREPEAPADIDDAEPDTAMAPPAPKIDISKFSTEVARLATNFSNMLDIEIVIVTRAYNHLANNYSPEVADEFEASMSQKGIELERPVTAEPETLPIAVGAGASGLGGP